MQPRPKGKRVGITTTTGAMGVLATDLVIREGLEMAKFSADTLAKLQTIFPDWQAPSNPFDFWVSVGIKGAEAAHSVALDALFAEPNVDMVFGILLAPKSADFPTFAPLTRRLREKYSKPCALMLMGDDTARRWSKEIEGDAIPIYTNKRAAIRALKLMTEAAG
jgi:acetate---CoA ligase (ADP-forming)